MAAPFARLGDFHNNEIEARQTLKVFCKAKNGGILEISFMRTVRVPDNNNTYQLPPDLGKFPIYSVEQYKNAFPEKMAAKGGVFIPMYQREAMWIAFTADRPFAVKVYVGGVNAISGEPKVETPASIARGQKFKKSNLSLQDYLVAGPSTKHQDWLDGIAKANGSVAQFVAMPIGSGHAVETHITGQDSIGGLQIEVMPIKYNCMKIQVCTLSGKLIPLDVTPTVTIAEAKDALHYLEDIKPMNQRLFYKGKQLEDYRTLADYSIEDGAKVHLVFRIPGGGNRLSPTAAQQKGAQTEEEEATEMGIAAGGSIEQVIRKDFHPTDIWDQDVVILLNVQILNSSVFSKITGLPAPQTPISATTYALLGYPFFGVSDEPTGIAGQFEGVKTVAEKNAEDKEMKNAEGDSQDDKDNEDLGEDEDEKLLVFPTVVLDDNLNPASLHPITHIEAESKAHGLSE